MMQQWLYNRLIKLIGRIEDNIKQYEHDVQEMSDESYGINCGDLRKAKRMKNILDTIDNNSKLCLDVRSFSGCCMEVKPKEHFKGNICLECYEYWNR